MIVELFAKLFETRRSVLVIGVVLLTGLAIWGHVAGGPSSEDQAANQPAKLESASEKKTPPPDFTLPKPNAYLVVEVENLFQDRTISALRNMVNAVEGLEIVGDVVWVDNVPTLSLFGTPKSVFPPGGSDDEAYQQSRTAVMEHPLIVGQLISEDLQTLLMPIQFDWINLESDEQTPDEILSTARNAIASSGEPDIRVRLTGPAPLFVETNKALNQNHIKFQIIGYSLAFVITVFLFRGLMPVFIVGCVPAVGIFWTTGLLQLFGERTNLLTDVIMPVLIAMVGLTDGVHLMMHIRHCRAAGMDRIAAAADAIRVIGLACGLTSLTTAVGFGSLMLSSAGFIQSFGRACMIGVTISFISVVTVIPLLSATRFGKNLHRGHEHDLIGRNLNSCMWILDFTIARPRMMSLLAITITIALAIPTLALRPDNQIKNALPSNSEIYDAMVHCDESMGGIDFAYVIMRWPKDATNGQILDFVVAVEELVETEPLLRHPLSIRNFLDSFPGKSLGSDARMAFLDLLPPELKSMLFVEERRQTLMTVRMADTGIAHYRPAFERLEKAFRGLRKEYPGFSASFAGLSYFRARELYDVVSDLAKSLGTAAAIIFVVLTIVYRSLRIGLISIIPNVFPLVVTATVLQLTGGSLDFASACAFTVCLGIAVDDTIHFLTRFKQEQQHATDHIDAVRRAFVGVGTALVTTTVILVVGFSTALTSSLPDHRMFAAMACATISSALFGDLLFLPALLTWFRPKG